MYRLQAPNLKSAHLFNMVHMVALTDDDFESIISCICSLKHLHTLDLDLAGCGRLDYVGLFSMVRLVQKPSLDVLIISGLTALQATWLMQVKRRGLCFSPWLGTALTT